MEVIRPYRIAIKQSDGSVKYCRASINSADGVKTLKAYIPTTLSMATIGTAKADISRAN